MSRHRVSIVIVACLGTLLSCKGQENRADLASMQMDATAPFEFDAHTTKANEDFIVFDGMHLRNKPAEIEEAGLVPIRIVYSATLFRENARTLRRQGSMTLPTRRAVARQAERTLREGYRYAVLDIEHWPLVGETIDRSIVNYLTVLEWFREAAPEIEWGYYGNVPVRNYDIAFTSESSDEFRDWVSLNTRLLSLAQSVEALYPSLYTTNRNREQWVRSARRHIAEARRLNPNVPVYIFIWPLYYNSTRRPIEADFWRLQLETARRYADGAVIWMTGSYQWDPDAPWWEETKDFMRELQDL